MQKRILIACYSWSSNTAKIAEKLQRATGGELFSIEPARDYPEDYQSTVQQAKKELADGFFPEIRRDIDITPYDIIFIGTPNWWSTAAPPVSAFIRGKDFSGKTVALFSTHGGGGIARTISDMAALCGNADVREGITVYNAGNSNTDRELAEWLSGIGIEPRDGTAR